MGPTPRKLNEIKFAQREPLTTRLRGLVSKPTLSRGEQMFVLAAMNDGLEI